MKFSNIKSLVSARKGFTLIELLIVIAVIGILAAVILVAVNPLEQLARGRDASRRTSFGQLKNAILNYYTLRNATYPGESDTWIADSVVATGELKQLPAAMAYTITGSLPCADSATVGRQNSYCYNVGAAGEVVLYVQLESGTEDAKCVTAADRPYFYFDSTTGVSCTVCGTTTVEFTTGQACVSTP